MGYYDVYDSNDNLIASEVWIDDGTSGSIPRPIVINWYKIFMILTFIIGSVSTIITPINLYINKDAFIGNTWLYMVLFNMGFGLPILLVSLNMLKIMYKKQKENDSIYEEACNWVNSKFITDKKQNNVDEEEMSNEEYISTMKNSNKKDAFIASLYIVIKYQNIMKKLTYISYLIYPLGIICILLEILIPKENAYFILLFNFNFIAIVCGLLSLYKYYKLYKKIGVEKAGVKLLKTTVISYIISVPLTAIAYSAFNADGYYLLVFCTLIMDLILFLDVKFISKNKIIENKQPINVIAILLITLCVSIVMLMVACVGSIIPGPIYDAILAYDEGLSPDLTLPIVFWISCLVMDIILIVVISKLINKKSNNK